MFKLNNSYHRLELLAGDLVITYVAGGVACVFNCGFANTVANFGTLCAETGLFTLFFLVGFLIWRPHDSFSRNLSTNDFIFTIAGLLTGAVLGCLFLFGNAFHSIFNYRDIALQAVLALIGIRGVRAIIRYHYYYYGKRSDSNGSYGLSEMALLNMEFADLLSRAPINIDTEIISAAMAGKVILVTGAAGSIGSALVRKLAEYSPERLIILDQAETPLHDLELELGRDFPKLHFQSILCDITSVKSLEDVFERYRPEVVFHAAAYKHVSMMEQNPVECVRNNIGGTVNLADLAVKYGCRKFVLISSDKAVNPSGFMGCSKRICEIYCQTLSTEVTAENEASRCSFITTRFGNVLGSNGSVIPIFREQIRRGGPLTLTHPDVIRYFMLVDEACDLVLEAAAMGKGGEIFVFDMGSPVKIVDLAKKMIRISRRNDIKIEYIGLSPGEKLYEEVLADKENVVSTVNEKLKVAKVRKSHPDDRDSILRLLRAAGMNDKKATIELMHAIVPEFNWLENRNE